jgi:hypothetical protein
VDLRTIKLYENWSSLLQPQGSHDCNTLCNGAGTCLERLLRGADNGDIEIHIGWLPEACMVEAGRDLLHGGNPE